MDIAASPLWHRILGTDSRGSALTLHYCFADTAGKLLPELTEAPAQAFQIEGAKFYGFNDLDKHYADVPLRLRAIFEDTTYITQLRLAETEVPQACDLRIGLMHRPRNRAYLTFDAPYPDEVRVVFVRPSAPDEITAALDNAAPDAPAKRLAHAKGQLSVYLFNPRPYETYGGLGSDRLGTLDNVLQRQLRQQIGVVLGLRIPKLAVQSNEEDAGVTLSQLASTVDATVMNIDPTRRRDRALGWDGLDIGALQYMYGRPPATPASKGLVPVSHGGNAVLHTASRSSATRSAKRRF